METILTLVAFYLLSIVTPAVKSAEDGAPIIPKLYRHPLLSADYVGIGITYSLDSEEEPYIVKTLVGSAERAHVKYQVDSQKGFAIIELMDGEELIWYSDSFHAEDVNIDIFEEIKYLRFNVHFGETLMETRYYRYKDNSWKEITRREHMVGLLDRLIPDTIELNASFVSLSRNFVSVKAGVVPSYKGGYMPKFHHFLETVTFNGRELWKYDRNAPVECIRADRISHRGTTLVLLHMVKEDGKYRTVIMFGEGKRSMTIQKYNNLLQEIASLPPIIVNKQVKELEVMKPKKKVYSAEDEEELRLHLIRVVEDGGVADFLENDEPAIINVDHGPVYAHADGMFTFEVYKYMRNRFLDVTRTKMNDDNPSKRLVFVARDGHLIGRITNKSAVLMETHDLFPYKALRYHLRDYIQALQVFATDAAGKIHMRYFSVGSTKIWRRCTRRAFMALRMSEMLIRTLDLADMERLHRTLVISRRRGWKSFLMPWVSGTIVTISPAFNVFIKTVEHNDETVWEYDVNSFRVLVHLQIWKYDERDIISIETVNGEDEHYEQMYALDNDQWKLVVEGPYLRSNKYAASVNLKKWRNEGIRIDGSRTISFTQFGLLEPIEGYYINEVTYGKLLLWEAKGRNHQCIAVYHVHYADICQVTLKMRGDDGHTHYVYLMRHKKWKKFVRVDPLIASYITRHWSDKQGFYNLFMWKKLPTEYFLDYIESRNRSARPSINSDEQPPGQPFEVHFSLATDETDNERSRRNLTIAEDDDSRYAMSYKGHQLVEEGNELEDIAHPVPKESHQPEESDATEEVTIF